MTGQVAVGHLAGKMISVLFFCLRSGCLYDPDRHARALGLDGWPRGPERPASTETLQVETPALT